MHTSGLYFSLLILFFCLSANVDIVAQASISDKVYAFYTPDGEALSFSDAVEIMAANEVVLFGEHHDHALIHWLQLQTTKALNEKTELVLGGEMFETDGQLLIDEYLMGLMTEKVFEDQARLWPNYKTDYKPLLEFAKSNNIAFIATNLPRRYASLVARHGLDTLAQLPAAARLLIPSLPISFSMETPGYDGMMEMMQGGHGMPFSAENFVKAQAIKDATMADRIVQHLQANSTFLHFNGDFHSADFGGIYWYLKQLNPKIKAMTIKIFSETGLDFQAEWEGSGDLILVVPEDFTRTH